MTGWRIGWAVLPEAVVRPVERIAQNLFISASALSQIAATAAFDATDELELVKAGYAANRALLAARMPAIGLDRFCPWMAPSTLCRRDPLHQRQRSTSRAACCWKPASPPRPAPISTPPAATPSCGFLRPRQGQRDNWRRPAIGLPPPGCGDGRPGPTDCQRAASRLYRPRGGGFTIPRTVLMGRSQAVRQRILIPPSPGSKSRRPSQSFRH